MNNKNYELATLGGGCFWCLEALLSRLSGVKSVIPGYAGGNSPNPTYDDVCAGETGHAEVVQVKFDPNRLPFAELLKVFFQIHNPTTLNRQGPDVGTQYRSVILYHSHLQKEVAQEVKELIESQKIWKDPIVTEIRALDVFYPAETVHLQYYERNRNQPYCQIVISPKLKRFNELFKESLKS